MEVIFLGTGQKERIPKNYHHDRVCLAARKPGAKENRTQSSVLISVNNKKILFDCTEDFLEQIEREKFDPNKLVAIFATDGHEESIGGLGFLDGRLNRKIKFYSSVKAIERVKERFKNLKNIEPEIIEDEKTIEIDKILVTPFKISSFIQERHSALAYQVKGKNTKIVYSKNTADVSEDKKHYYEKNDYLIIGGAYPTPDWLANLGNKNTIFTWIGHGLQLHSEMEESIKNEYKNFK